jgi:hypothetical protein
LEYVGGHQYPPGSEDLMGFPPFHIQLLKKLKLQQLRVTMKGHNLKETIWLNIKTTIVRKNKSNKNEVVERHILKE